MFSKFDLIFILSSAHFEFTIPLTSYRRVNVDCRSLRSVSQPYTGNGVEWGLQLARVANTALASVLATKQMRLTVFIEK